MGKYGMDYGASKYNPPKTAAKVKGINMVESRLNAGGDTAYMGKRRKPKGGKASKMKGGYGYTGKSYGGSQKM